MVIRRTVPDDCDALRKLYEGSPDTGHISFVPSFRTDPLTAYTSFRPRTTGFVATQPSGEIVGAGFISFYDGYYGGDRRPIALLHSIAVLPEYRGQGIGTKLATHRVQFAKEKLGPECIVVAFIQKGNQQSVRVAQQWADTLRSDFELYVAKPRSTKPVQSSFDFGELGADGVEEYVTGVNRFYNGTDLFRPYSPSQLQSQMKSNGGEPLICRYYICKNPQGRVVAGARVTEQFRLFEMEVHDIPLSLQLLNRVLKLVPPDEPMRLLQVEDLWFESDQLEAGTYLWEMLQATMGEANRILMPFDSEGPLKDILKLRPWTPTLQALVAVQGANGEGDSRVIAPVL